VIGESYPDGQCFQALFDNVDVVMWHVHPWWQGAAINTRCRLAQAAHEAVLAKMKAYGITKPERLAETGSRGRHHPALRGLGANESQYLHDLKPVLAQSEPRVLVFEGFERSLEGRGRRSWREWGMWTSDRAAHARRHHQHQHPVPSAEGWTK